VGAVVLALGVAVVVPMLLEPEQKPLPEDVSVKIPPIDDGKFENRLGEHRTAAAPVPAAPPADAAKESAAKDAAASAPGRTSRYDTRIPENPANAPAPSPPAGASQTAATPSPPVVPPQTAATPSPPAGSSQTAAPPSSPTPPTTAASPKAAPQIANAPSAAAERTKAPEARAADAQTHASAAHEGFAVQLAAFADDKGANALAGRLKRAGYAAYTEPLKTSKGTLWRVRVGPYSSREAAVAARDKLTAEGQSGIVAAIN
jgi:DedD protein